MNYRHAYHAGNWADCMKHALLVWLLRALALKQKPFFVLDTHAGLGHYDLDAEQARRTGEADAGIRRLLDAPSTVLADYLGLVRELGLYPGSPAIIRALLRPGDRLVCCELHPEDHAVLRRHFGRDPQAHVHLRDGFAALGALLPPPERRGLVLIDPPYEAPDEYLRVAAGLATANARFPGGVLAAWYPIKHRAPVRAFHATIRDTALRDVVAAEFLLRSPLDAARLNGCGLLVVNPPWGFETAVLPILDALFATARHRRTRCRRRRGAPGR
ncbi:MAG: 23S rRNA (adenine(2030)-N(6))-methyltransferase RlmJ [Rhodospirillales bacterium]